MKCRFVASDFLVVRVEILTVSWRPPLGPLLLPTSHANQNDQVSEIKKLI